MKLLIRRDQDSGFFGGISFKVNARVELTEDELKIIKKYKAHKTPLLTKNSMFGPVDYKIEDLINGVQHKCKDIGEVIEFENIVKEACRNFDTTVKVMASFGGEIVIDFNENG